MATKKAKADQPTSAVQPGEYDFDKFVSYGIAAGANVVNGMPWSFKFGDYPVTHENDNLYLIAYDNETIRFARGDTLDVSDLGIVHRQANADATGTNLDYQPLSDIIASLKAKGDDLTENEVLGLRYLKLAANVLTSA